MIISMLLLFILHQKSCKKYIGIFINYFSVVRVLLAKTRKTRNAVKKEITNTY